MDKKTEALKLALEALTHFEKAGLATLKTVDAITAIREALAEQCVCGEPDTFGTHRTDGPCLAEQPAQQQALPDFIAGAFGVSRGTAYDMMREALAEQPAQDNTYNYAKSLAEAIFKQHFASDEHYASGRIVWGVNDTVIGILTQIDNMVADMVRRPAQQQEPVAVIRSVVHSGDGGVRVTWLGGFPQIGDLLYTSPPASKPLTDEQIAHATAPVFMGGNPSLTGIARAIETAHGIKGDA